MHSTTAKLSRALLLLVAILICGLVILSHLGNRVDDVFMGSITVESHRDLSSAEIDPSLLLPNSQVISASIEIARQRDKTIETRYTQQILHLETSLDPSTILDTYQRVLLADGWEYICAPRPVDRPIPETWNEECSPTIPWFAIDWKAQAIYVKPDQGKLNIIIGKPIQGVRTVQLFTTDITGLAAYDTFGGAEVGD